ncbi:MAG: hypothetical protein COT55_01985 [Candidatus Diapherotrites archaeon CG09_land_8_20_14_0_10_32_12]|nr:MAG: hypothetical protein COT55_01985 [Candidatus Diapherotrites archaeon CG09_land_8_20_14_0_10_32_12]
MEFIGTLRIRKEGTGYTIKYNSLYFYFNSVEYSQLKKVYALITDNKNISDKQKKTQIYSFLYATGNVPRSGISVSENYADFICLNSKRIKKSNKFRKDLAFFLDTFFTTAKIAICDKEKKILSLSNKERVYDDLLAMENNNDIKIRQATMKEVRTLGKLKIDLEKEEKQFAPKGDFWRQYLDCTTQKEDIVDSLTEKNSFVFV